LAALLQIPSTLTLMASDSAGSRWITDLQTATACVTAAELGATTGALGVEVLVGVLVALVGVLVALAGVVLAGADVVVVLLLPHPARSAPPISMGVSKASGLRIMGVPLA